MGTSIGLLELKSIPIGIKTADEMLKAANVKLLLAAPICPGKFVIVVSGNVGAVKAAVTQGESAAGTFNISSYIINNASETLPAAIAGTAEAEVLSLGAIETMSAMTAIIAGDIAVKASNVKLIEIRIARGLGGKGYLLFTGEISSVNSALKACTNELGDLGEITSTCAIPSPTPEVVRQIL